MRVEYTHIQEMLETLEYKYAVIEGTTTTVCKAILPNGFTVGTGESACIDPSNFCIETGKKFAKERAVANATDELWKLEGYLLKVTGKTSNGFKGE